MSEQIELVKEEPVIEDTIGVSINPTLVSRYTSEDMAEVYCWAYNNAVFDVLKILIDATSALLADEVVVSTGRSISFALGFKSAFTFLNEYHEKMDQDAFKESAREFLKTKGL